MFLLYWFSDSVAGFITVLPAASINNLCDLLSGNHDYVPDNTLPATINDIYVNISQSWNALGWFDKNITTIDEFNAGRKNRSVDLCYVL